MSVQRHRLMLVEEDQLLADITAFRLELLGYEVTVVHSAEDATTALSGRLPSALILDLRQPRMSGLEFLETLARNERTSRLPVLAMSIDAELESVQRAYCTGAADYLVAPYDPTVLEEKVARLLERFAHDGLADQEEPEPAAEANEGSDAKESRRSALSRT